MTMITLTGIAQPGYTSFDNLSSFEQQAVEIIKSTLNKNNLPSDALYYRYTTEYLAVESIKMHPFARLKLTGKVWYMGLNCGDEKTNKNFARFDIFEVSDIVQYNDKIIDAFRSSDPKYTIRYYAKLKSVDGIEQNLIDFFNNLECYKKDVTITPNDMCLKFFKTLLDKMDQAGLDWRKTHKDISSNGAIKFCGGIARFGPKSSYVRYQKGESLFDFVTIKNASLDEYLAIQKYWVNHYAKNRAIYESPLF